MFSVCWRADSIIEAKKDGLGQQRLYLSEPKTLSRIPHCWVSDPGGVGASLARAGISEAEAYRG